MSTEDFTKRNNKLEDKINEKNRNKEEGIDDFMKKI